MLFTNMTFIGIDPTAGRTPFVVAAINHEKEIVAICRGDMEEVMAFVRGQQSAHVAVCSPRQPNQGLMAQEAVRDQFSTPPKPGRWMEYRVAEYALRLRKIKVPPTPVSAKKSPGWMKKGFEVFKKLESIGCVPYPAEGKPFQSLEVYPHAAYTVLLGHKPFPKMSLEGRIQRQLALYVEDLPVPNPMRFFEEVTQHRLLQGILPTEGLYDSDELDALVAAYTAWRAAADPRSVSTLGDPREGEIVLPTSQLQLWY